MDTFLVPQPQGQHSGLVVRISALQHWGTVQVPVKTLFAWILHVFPVLVWVSFRFFGFLLHAGMLLVLFKIGPTVIIYWACPRWLPHHLLQQQIRDHMEKSATEILKLISFLAESTAGFHAQAEWQLLNGPQCCGNATSSVHIGPLYQ